MLERVVGGRMFFRINQLWLKKKSWIWQEQLNSVSVCRPIYLFLFLSFVCSLNLIRQIWFIPQLQIPLLYNAFTIVLHKRLSAYLFRAVHTPACWIGTKQNKDFHPATPQPIQNPDYWPNPSRMWIWNKKEGNWLFCKEAKLEVKSKLKKFLLCL